MTKIDEILIDKNVVLMKLEMKHIKHIVKQMDENFETN
jgi:hypothetical protein